MKNHSMRRFLALFGVSALAATGISAATAPAASAATCAPLVAVGDIAGGDDYKTGANRTGAQIKALNPGKVLLLGDLAYDNGTRSQFDNYFNPGYGWLKTDPRAVFIRGNHEGTGSGLASYLGSTKANGNHAFTYCGWRIVAIDMYGSSISSGASYIASQRAAYPNAPMIVAYHEPWRTSGSEHGTSASSKVAPLWKAAVAAKARLVLNGHDHDSEMFWPMNASGTRVSTGTVEVVSGKGGHHLKPWGTIRANSRFRDYKTPGVFILSLNDANDAYSYQEKNVDGVVEWSGSEPATH